NDHRVFEYTVYSCLRDKRTALSFLREEKRERSRERQHEKEMGIIQRTDVWERIAERPLPRGDGL
ncbi:Piezo-type mechanosensitive ion channel component 2, partial [Dissostichus eleginoides]